MPDRKFITSLTTPKGRIIKDMTTSISAGSFSREKNNIGGFSATLTNDESANHILRKIHTWKTWVQCEEIVDGKESEREIVYAGPITDSRPGYDGIELTGSDITAYWPKILVTNSEYKENDVAFLAETFLTENLAKNPNSMPILKVFTSGYKDDIDSAQADTKFVSDFMSGFPGLTYVAVGRQLFLFGLETQPEPTLRFDDESWLQYPAPEDSGAIYANGVLIVGTKVKGYAELNTIDPDVGLLVRRFDLPEITSESVAQEAARVRLAQVSANVMLAGQDLELAEGSMEVETSVHKPSNSFIPGSYVDIKSYITGEEKIQKLLLDKFSVDLITGVRTVSFSPLDRLGVLDAG